MAPHGSGEVADDSGHWAFTLETVWDVGAPYLREDLGEQCMVRVVGSARPGSDKDAELRSWGLVPSKPTRKDPGL